MGGSHIFDAWDSKGVVYIGGRHNGIASWLYQKIAKDIQGLIGFSSQSLKANERQKMSTSGNPHIGSDFEDFLAEEGTLDSATAVAVKRVISWQIE